MSCQLPSNKYHKAAIILIALCVFTGGFKMLKKHYIFPKKKKGFSIQKVYVINLDRSKDRWNKIHNDLNKANIQHERFPGVDGLKLKFIDEFGNRFTGADLKSGKVRIRIGEKYKILCPNITLTYIYEPMKLVHDSTQGWGINAREFGCFCSHLEIMRLILIAPDNGLTLILEDDAIIPSDFKQKLDTLSSNLISAKHWDWIQLFQDSSMSKVKIQPKIPFNDHLRRVSGGRLRTHAYILRREVARKIMYEMDRVFTTIDEQVLYYNKQNLRILESDINIDQTSSPINNLPSKLDSLIRSHD